MSNETPILSIKNIEVVYSRVISALHGVSIDVQKGEIVSLLGANGSGKTTTCKAVSRLLEAERGEISKGSIEYNGENISHMTPFDMVKAGVVQVLEGRHIFGHLTVEENLLTGSFIRNADNASVKRDLEHVYERFTRIKDRRKNLGGLCSGGEQQMLAIARGMMGLPKLLMVDEPFLGLSPMVMKDLIKIFKNIVNEGISILFVEQNVRLALSMADRGYVLESGRLVIDGKSSDLIDNEKVTKVFLGN